MMKPLRGDTCCMAMSEVIEMSESRKKEKEQQKLQKVAEAQKLRKAAEEEADELRKKHLVELEAAMKAALLTDVIRLNKTMTEEEVKKELFKTVEEFRIIINSV